MLAVARSFLGLAMLALTLMLWRHPAAPIMACPPPPVARPDPASVVVRNIHWNETPLKQAASELETKTGVHFNFDWPALEANQIDGETRVSLEAGEISLAQILKSWGNLGPTPLDFQLLDGQCVVRPVDSIEKVIIAYDLSEVLQRYKDVDVREEIVARLTGIDGTDQVESVRFFDNILVD